jgi:hypothetical protein
MEPLPNLRVQVFEPRNGVGDKVGFRQKEVPDMTAGRAALIELVRRYLNGLLDPSVSLLEVHKLMYFMQEAGEPLRLKFVKGPYGPYAENLRHVLKEIEGHFLSGYADGGDAPGKELHLVPGAGEEAQKVLQSKPDSMMRFEKVSNLVEGFESPFGLELLATTHWVATRENVPDVPTAVARIHDWSQRKKRYSGRQIELAFDALSNHGWLRS